MNGTPHESMLGGWGRQFVPASEVAPEDLRSAPLLHARGLARSYGDCCLPPPGNPRALNTTRANRILGFDRESGLLRAEAGLSLFDINRTFVQRGFFPPVTPGTQFVTLGGAVASDVHGKNHHREGTFGSHVQRILLRLANGEIVECGPNRERELFLATVGGMGLTGTILEVEFPLTRIPSPWILQETERVADIDEYVERLAVGAAEWPMTVGWIDCLAQGTALGRGVLMKGRWATPEECADRVSQTGKGRLRVPFVAPEWVLSRPVMQLFNFTYYWSRASERSIVGPTGFFYPLDAVGDWNKIYGPRGFTQYQCVLPTSAGPGAARRFLELISSRGGSSFLCVIKDCGAESDAYLSFPCPGISIAVDIPVRDTTQALIDAMNEQVLSEGGRVYLAKDNFTRREHFQEMEKRRLPTFLQVRDRYDPNRVFRSAQSHRLLGDPP